MNKKGFTLMEVLTVVIIIGVLASVALPQYRKVVDKSKFTKAQVMAKSLYDSCERLVAEWGVENFTSLPSAVQKISRLDIGEDSLLPRGFSVISDTQINGVGFSYTLTGNCEVNINQTEGTYAGTTLTYNGTDFTCANHEEGCNVYGLSADDE